MTLNHCQSTAPYPPNTYETKDWHETAILLANNLPLIDIRNDGSIFFFKFSDKERATKLVEGFWRGDLFGNFRTLVDCQQRIKQIVRRGNEHGHEYKQKPVKT